MVTQVSDNPSKLELLQEVDLSRGLVQDVDHGSDQWFGGIVPPFSKIAESPSVEGVEVAFEDLESRL